MIKFGVFFAFIAVVYSSGVSVVPYASPVGATLLPKVNVAPAKVTVVKQPYVVTHTEAVYRSVPVPVRAVAYTAPRVVAPAPVAYAAVPPVVAAHPVVPAHSVAAAPIAPIW